MLSPTCESAPGARPAPGVPFKRTGESEALPTETPPPYFPQAMLSPGDEKTARKTRLAIYGCGFMLLLALGGAVWGVVYLVRSLS